MSPVREDTRQLIGKSIPDNTKTAYYAGLASLDAAIDPYRQTDHALADYIAGLHAAGTGGLSAHRFRVGLANELTARGASTTETMLTGRLSTAWMVAHYSAGATAERRAVGKYL